MDASACRIEPAVHGHPVRGGVACSGCYGDVVSWDSQQWHAFLLFKTASSKLVRVQMESVICFIFKAVVKCIFKVVD